MNIGKSLKSRREKAGLSQSELSRKTGLNQKSMSRWELEINPPSITDCVTLARFYKISVDELIGYTLEDSDDAPTV
ncbi:MAG: helix-turn-helix domain-containing protein [Candidatus Borkfalkia sp.]